MTCEHQASDIPQLNIFRIVAHIRPHVADVADVSGMGWFWAAVGAARDGRHHGSVATMVRDSLRRQRRDSIFGGKHTAISRSRARGATTNPQSVTCIAANVISLVSHFGTRRTFIHYAANCARSNCAISHRGSNSKGEPHHDHRESNLCIPLQLSPATCVPTRSNMP